MHEKCLKCQSLFERILIYVYLKLLSRDGATRIMTQNYVIEPIHVRIGCSPISIATRVCTRKFCIILIREWRREENACVVNERKEGRHQVVRHKMVVDKNTPFEKRAKLLSRLVTTPTHRNRANTPTIMRGWRYLHDHIWRNGARNNSNHFARVKFYENFNENSP